MKNKKVFSVFLGGKFFKSYDEDGKLRLFKDYRAKLIGEKNLMKVNRNLNIGKYYYMGPFYEEEASNGILTSTDCETVVREELEAIAKCDIFVAYLNEKISAGTIVELMHAANNNRKIHLLIVPKENSEYSIKTGYWFPIQSAMYYLKDKDNLIIDYVENQEAAVEKIKEIYC